LGGRRGYVAGMKLSNMVEEQIAARFDPDDAWQVQAALEEAPLPLLEQPSRQRDRVHLAIITLAEGDFGKFRQALRLAQTDWRDVLVAAGLASADWPLVLARAGIRLP
jgi:hypothetical protein